jgi:hypothetical protein
MKATIEESGNLPVHWVFKVPNSTKNKGSMADLPIPTIFP